MSERFAADWLGLRERFDAASRSRALAARLVAALPDRPVLLDIGAGTGSMLRWLAPMIGRDHVWIMQDADAELLDRAVHDIADWAEAQGFSAAETPGGVSIQAEGSEINVLMHAADVSDPARLPLAHVDAVVCSALLDLVSARWIEAFADRLEVPLLACLSVDGRDRILPPHAADAALRAGFRRDQGRNKGFGPALGPRADAVLRAALKRRGFAVTGATSDWHIPRGEISMLGELVDGHAMAALHQLPGLLPRIRHWRETRLHQLRRAALAMRIGHRDTLALPQGGN